MKKLFLASYFKKVAGLFEAFAGDVRGKVVTFIPTASNVESVSFFVGSGKKALEKMGMIVDELDIATASADDIAAKLARGDMIYVSGGNTFYLLQEMLRTGAGAEIAAQIDAGKIYIGESAGAMIVAPNIDYAKAMDSVKKAPELTGFEALGLVDFYPVPHHTNAPFKKAVEKIIAEYGESRNLRPMTNDQAIVIDGDDVRVLNV